MRLNVQILLHWVVGQAS